jgi:hypothetical protein
VLLLLLGNRYLQQRIKLGGLVENVPILLLFFC